MLAAHSSKGAAEHESLRRDGGFMSKLIADTTEQPAVAPALLWPRGGAGIKAVSVGEIGLADLEERDLLLIQTANSVYSFSLTDADERCGMLMGGQLGEASAPALLVGAQGPEKGEAGVCRTRLMAGLPAVFIVASKRESRRLVTSAIKSMTHLKSLLGQSRNPAGIADQP